MEITQQKTSYVTLDEEALPRRSALECEVNLAQGTWILAEHVRPGDLVSISEVAPPFIVGDWVGSRDGIIIFSDVGEQHLCPVLLPYIFMVEADFMKKNFPSAM